jgi:hypothetical protein
MFLQSKRVYASRALLQSFVLTGVFLCPALLAHGAGTAQLAIKVDQVGYPLNGPKVALVSSAATSFELRRAGDNAVVFQGKLTAAQADKDSGDQVQAADFSLFHQAGRYYLSVQTGEPVCF